MLISQSKDTKQLQNHCSIQMLGSIVYVFNTTINTIRKATIIKQNSTLSHIHSKFSFWVLRYNTKRKEKKKQQNLKFQHFPLFRFQQNKHHNSIIFILNIFFYISFQYLGLSEKPNRESKLTKKKKNYRYLQTSCYSANQQGRTRTNRRTR